MRLAVPALAALAAVSAPLAAQETLPLPDDYTPPSASIHEFWWMEGHWQGAGIGGNTAHENWLPPTGNTMVGTFVQTDAGGGIQFTEHMYLMDEDGSVVLRLKHFNADLTGWEERDDTTTFRLVAVEPCAAFFGGLTIRCDDDDGLVVAVRMRSSAGELSELLFDFDRADPVPRRSSACDDPATTVEMNECYSGLLAQAEERRETYLSAALARHQDDGEITELLQAGGAAFTAYRDAECGAVYRHWMSGTIRDVMNLTCRIGMTDEYTRTLWQHWLTYQDSSPPVLPEPEPLT